MSCLRIYSLLAAFFYAVLFANAQNASPWCDPVTTVCFLRYFDTPSSVGWGYLFPKSTTTDEFLGIITAPTGVSWVGADLGETMAGNLLLVGWMNGATPIISPRYVTGYSLPSPYAGPKVTLLSTSGINGTTQRFVYRCQNCTSWTGGKISLGAPDLFAFAIGSTPVTTPSDPNTAFRRHSSVGVYGIDLSSPNATSSDYTAIISSLTPKPKSSSLHSTPN